MQTDWIDELGESTLDGRDLREAAMERLAEIEGYDWCGIYRLEDDALHLDAYVGAPTDHVRIPVGVGVCGTAVAEDANQIVADVRQLDNYLACSLTTQSEIVVLIRDHGRVLGQIDIDSHQINRFGPEDEAMLEKLAHLLGSRW